MKNELTIAVITVLSLVTPGAKGKNAVCSLLLRLTNPLGYVGYFCSSTDLAHVEKFKAILLHSLLRDCELTDDARGETMFRSKWGHGQTANINDYVDKTINMLVPFIQSNGLDPMSLPDVVEGFEVKPIWITYSAWLKIHDGYMTGLVNLSRSGDQKVNYFAKMLRIRVQLKFSDLTINYKYLVKVMNLGPTGGIIGSINRLEVVADVLFDFNNDEIQLQEFSLTDIGRLRVRLTGNKLVDWLVNPVMNVFLRIYNTIIIDVVEINIVSAIQNGINFINANLQDSIKYLESYN